MLQTKETAASAAVGDCIFSINPSWIDSKTREAKLSRSRMHNKVSIKHEQTKHLAVPGNVVAAGDRQAIQFSPRSSAINHNTGGTLSSQRVSLATADPNNV